MNHSDFDEMLLEIDAWIAEILDDLEQEWIGEREENRDLYGSTSMLADMLDIDEGGTNG